MTDKDVETILAFKLSEFSQIEDVFIIGGNKYYKVFIVINENQDNQKIYDKEYETLDCDAAIDYCIINRDGRRLEEVRTFNLNYYRHIYHRE